MTFRTLRVQSNVEYLLFVMCAVLVVAASKREKPIQLWRTMATAGMIREHQLEDRKSGMCTGTFKESNPSYYGSRASAGTKCVAPCGGSGRWGLTYCYTNLDTKQWGAECVTCPAPESCEDGIKNQDETDTDCGGSNCSPCRYVVTAQGDSCSDGGMLDLDDRSECQTAILDIQDEITGASFIDLNIDMTDRPVGCYSPNVPNFFWNTNGQGGACSSCQSVCKGSKGPYELVHGGHCAAGWDSGPNTNQATINDCRKECASRQNVGYFAYRDGNNCACYFLAAGCPDDDQNDDHNAYRILRPTAATCNDGILNQDETDVDCGGDSCNACHRYTKIKQRFCLTSDQITKKDQNSNDLIVSYSTVAEAQEACNLDSECQAIEVNGCDERANNRRARNNVYLCRVGAGYRYRRSSCIYEKGIECSTADDCADNEYCNDEVDPAVCAAQYYVATMYEECSTIDMIGTKEECQTAASQVNYPFLQELKTTERMKGCYLNYNSKVVFNKISASSSTAQMKYRHGICKKQDCSKSESDVKPGDGDGTKGNCDIGQYCYAKSHCSSMCSKSDTPGVYKNGDGSSRGNCEGANGICVKDGSCKEAVDPCDPDPCNADGATDEVCYTGICYCNGNVCNGGQICNAGVCA